MTPRCARNAARRRSLASPRTRAAWIRPSGIAAERAAPPRRKPTRALNLRSAGGDGDVRAPAIRYT